MPKVRFNLKEPNKSGLCAINLVLEYNNQKLKYGTGLTINPKYWDAMSQRAKRNNVMPYSEFNQRLQYLETETERIFYRLQNDCKTTPSVQNLKVELDILTQRNQVKPVTLFEYFESRIKELKTERPNSSTSKHYGTTFNTLKDYKSHKAKKTLDFQDITDAFFKDFEAFAYQIKKYNPNTFWKYITILKTAMREAQDKSYHNNEHYKRFSSKKVPTHEIYLDEIELEKIYRLDLTEKKGHDITRDLFIIGCFTGGLRFSDWAKIRPNQIKEENRKMICTVTTEKTGQIVSFPLTHSYVKEILIKYDNNLPKPLSNQKSNEYLKDIGKWATIDIPTIKTEYPSGIRTETTVFKYELITTHTARRSFATNLANRKYPLHQIRLMTGHATEKQLHQYLKTSSLENAVSVADTDFFKS